MAVGGKLALATYIALVFNGFAMVAPSLFRPFQAESLAPIIAKFIRFYWLQRILTCFAHTYLAYISTSIYMLIGPLFFIFSVPYLTAIKEQR